MANASADFDSEWVTIGTHRVLLTCRYSFPTPKLRFWAELAAEIVSARSPARHLNQDGARVTRVFMNDKSDTITIDVATDDPNEVFLETAVLAAFDAIYPYSVCDGVTVTVFKPGWKSGDGFNQAGYFHERIWKASQLDSATND